MRNEKFIAGMRRITYPVCIISARANGKKLAITVSSVTSVSVEPPTLLVCINNLSSMAKALLRGSLLNVNFLSSKQRTLADICADKNKAGMRFSSDEWLYDSSGTPYVDQSEMVAFCEVDNIVSQTSHKVAFLRVLTVILPPLEKPSPLLYQNGSYINLIEN